MSISFENFALAKKNTTIWPISQCWLSPQTTISPKVNLNQILNNTIHEDSTSMANGKYEHLWYEHLKKSSIKIEKRIYKLISFFHHFVPMQQHACFSRTTGVTFSLSKNNASSDFKPATLSSIEGSIQWSGPIGWQIHKYSDNQQRGFEDQKKRMTLYMLRGTRTAPDK